MNDSLSTFKTTRGLPPFDIESNQQQANFDVFVNKSHNELDNLTLEDYREFVPLYFTAEGTNLALSIESIDYEHTILIINSKEGKILEGEYKDIQSFCSALLEDFEPNSSFFDVLREISKKENVFIADPDYTVAFSAKSVLAEAYNQAFFVDYVIPSHFTSYLFDDDSSSLTNDEIHAIDIFAFKIMAENPEYDSFIPMGSINKGVLDENDVTGDVQTECTLVSFKVKEERKAGDAPKVFLNKDIEEDGIVSIGDNDSAPDKKSKKKKKVSHSIKP